MSARVNVQVGLLVEDLVASLEGALVHLLVLAPLWGDCPRRAGLVLRAILRLLGLDGAHEAVNVGPEEGRRRFRGAGLERGRQAAVVHGKRGQRRGLGLDVRAVRNRREPARRRVAVRESARRWRVGRLRNGALVVHVVLLDWIVRGHIETIGSRLVGHGGWHARRRIHWECQINDVGRVGPWSLRGHVHEGGRTSLGIPDRMRCWRHHDGHGLITVVHKGGVGTSKDRRW